MKNITADLAAIAHTQGEVAVNAEWQLAEMVDAIAAEIDHAEDTLALKSYARGMSFSLRQLSLDLQVAVRRDDNGQVKFRTAEPNSTGATTIKLDFAQLLKSQLSDDRRKLEQNIDRRPLDAIGLTPAEIRSLNAIAIYAIDDLHRYTQTAAMIGEVSRKANLDDARLRQVLGLPYLEALKPNRGLPGSTILLEGGNFGVAQPSQATVYFQGERLPILAWNNARIEVQIPPTATGNGVIFVVINDQISNTIDWQVLAVDLIVKDITIMPRDPQENDEITVTASLVNQGTGAANAFTVQWSIDGQAQNPQPHGILLPGQASQESSLVWKTRLPAGEHKFSFTADPEQLLTDIDRANSTFSQGTVVAAAQNLSFGDYRVIDSLDPFVSEQPWNLRQSVLTLVYRGLMRLDPNNGTLLNDLSQPPPRNKGNQTITHSFIQPSSPLGVDSPFLPVRSLPLTLTYQLRPDLRFHDGSEITPEDVLFSYQRARESSPWAELLGVITTVEIIDRATIIFTLSEALAANLNPQIWTLPIVPARAYQADPKRFINRPIGCGPFMAALKQDGKSGLVRLKAFEQYYLGKPRLQNLSIMMQANTRGLLNLLTSGEVGAIALPDQEGLADNLSSLQEKYHIIRTTTGNSAMLHLQTRALLERLPNDYETNWNAHLWYSP